MCGGGLDELCGAIAEARGAYHVERSRGVKVDISRVESGEWVGVRFAS